MQGIMQRHTECNQNAGVSAKINEQVNIREIEQVVTNRLLSQKQYEIDLQRRRMLFAD